MKKNELIKKVEEGFSIKKLSKHFNHSISSVRYWLKKYNLKTFGYVKTNNWTEENLIIAVNKSECKSDVLRNLGISTKSGNFQTLDRYLKKYSIDTTRLKYKNNRDNAYKSVLTYDDIFIENSEITRGVVKRRILKDKLIEYKCEKCNNNGKWNEEILLLQLDHINGVNNDHRIKNLRFLCPNCHSQTQTYCKGKNRYDKKEHKCEICNINIASRSKFCVVCYTKNIMKNNLSIINRRKVVRPTYQQLLKEISELGYLATGRRYGVSDNSIRKWIKNYEKYGI